MRGTAPVLALLLLGLPALAQQSASFNLEEHTINAGGHPDDATVMASASFRITLDSIGDGVSGNSMGSASFRIDGGFAGSYPPPGEVSELWFTDPVTLEWDPERSVGDYAVYSGVVGNLPADYGVCEDDVEIETATVDDPVAEDVCRFYLVTARNRLGEEGTKGFPSSGPERSNDTPCP
jgi:hypothetical protein